MNHQNAISLSTFSIRRLHGHGGDVIILIIFWMACKKRMLDVCQTELVIVLTLECVRERGKLVWECGVEDAEVGGYCIYFLTFP